MIWRDDYLNKYSADKIISSPGAFTQQDNMPAKINSSTRLTILVLVLSFFILGIGIYGIHELKIMNQNTETLYTDRIIPIGELTNIRYSYLKEILATAQQANMKQIPFSQAIQQIEDAEKNIHADWEAYKRTYLTNDETALLKQTEPLMVQGNDIIERLKNALVKKDQPRVETITNGELSAGIYSVLYKINDLVHLQIKVSGELHEGNKALYNSTSKKFYISIILALLFGLGLSVLIVGDNKRLMENLKAGNRKITESEEKLRAFIEYAGDAIFMINEKFRIVGVNNSACNLVGYTREELIGMSPVALIPPGEERDDYEEKIQSSLSRAGTLYERKLMRKDGSLVETEVNMRSLDGDGYISIIRDVTEIRKTQKQLTEKEYQYTSLFNQALESIAIFDNAGNIIDVNESLCKLTGFTKEELLHKHAEDLVETENLKNIPIDYDVKPVGHVMITPRRLRKKSGGFADVEVSRKQIADNRILTIGRDISERKKSEAEIIKLSRLNELKSSINELMLKSSDKEEIYRETCRIAVEYGKFRMAWVGYYNEEEFRVMPFASSGHEDGYLKDVLLTTTKRKITIDGPVERSLRSKKVAHCNDIATDPCMQTWKNEALKRGFGSCVSLPVIVDNSIEAFILLYMQDAFFFNEAEIELLQNLTDNIGYGLDKIRIEALQKRSEKELIESEQKFRILVEHSLVGVVILREEKFIYVNPAFENISGYSADELLHGMTLNELIHTDDLERIAESYNKRMDEGQFTAHYILKAIRKGGALRHIEIIISTIIYNDKPAIIGTAIDISDRIREETRLGKAVTDAQEKERIQIGMELHDNVKQLLAGSLLFLDLVSKNPDDKSQVSEFLGNVKAYVREAIDELRRLSHQLAPSLESGTSLADKLSELINNMNAGGKLKVTVTMDTSYEHINKDIQLNCYRIVQEQFSNIIKYAEASRVEIIIEHDEKNILMSIKDDGIGFDPRPKKTGIGLENIRRRAQVLNGSLKIISSPGNGCTLIILIPLNKELPA